MGVVFPTPFAKHLQNVFVHFYGFIKNVQGYCPLELRFLYKVFSKWNYHIHTFSFWDKIGKKYVKLYNTKESVILHKYEMIAHIILPKEIFTIFVSILMYFFYRENDIKQENFIEKYT